VTDYGTHDAGRLLPLLESMHVAFRFLSLVFKHTELLLIKRTILFNDELKQQGLISLSLSDPKDSNPTNW
jgi:hypothetical protein